MIRPWYRSRLFWLGLPGLVFLLWAWGHSNSFRRTLFLSKSSHLSTVQGKLLWFSGQTDIEHDYRMDFRAGGVAVDSYYFPPGGPVRAVYYFKAGAVDSAEIPAADACWFPPPRWQARVINRDTHYRLLSLPYWLLTGGYVALWLGTLAFWQRRNARLSKTPALLPP